MDASVLKYIIFGSIGLLVIAGIAYFALAKQMGKSEYARIKKLQQGTKTSGFSSMFYTFLVFPQYFSINLSNSTASVSSIFALIS